MLLRARIILPVSSLPVCDGGLLIQNDRIQAVGPFRELARASQNFLDLGDCVVLPGLVNAHCHLDYTSMAGRLAPPKHFADWIPGMLSLKAHSSYSDYAQSWIAGASMLLRCGTTTVADIEAVPELLPDVWSATPLRIISFLELTGVKGDKPAAAILRQASDVLDKLPETTRRAGISPHAPYSTRGELLGLCAEYARQRQLPVSMHVAESADEFEMFAGARGPLFDWLKNQRDMADCGLGSPVQHLDRHGLLRENLVAAHVNYLGPGDAELLARRQVSVAHCPRSHAYFRHQPFPRNELAAAGVNLCLGTDSLVSVWPGTNAELDLFAEMRTLANSDSTINPRVLLEMCTTNAARALGRAREIGRLSPGALADLIVLPYAGPSSRVCERIIQHRGPVSRVMIGGQWVFETVAA